MSFMFFPIIFAMLFYLNKQQSIRIVNKGDIRLSTYSIFSLLDIRSVFHARILKSWVQANMTYMCTSELQTSYGVNRLRHFHSRYHWQSLLQVFAMDAELQQVGSQIE